jgi:hypothetical protein
VIKIAFKEWLKQSMLKEKEELRLKKEKNRKKAEEKEKIKKINAQK